MSSDLGYYRHPTVCGNDVVFVCDDDLWKVDTSQEGPLTARRLTANPGICSFPRLSPDGAMLAYTGRDDGPAEVYVMPSEGGVPRRLTWMGALTQVVGWSKDGSAVLAATDWRQPFEGSMHLIHVPLDGDPPTLLNYGPARAIAFGPDANSVVIGRNSGDPARWKRYRGGTAGTLWIDRNGSGSFRKLLQLDGNLASPMWVGSRVYFLSDHEGNGNLYSCTPTGRGLKRHSDHDAFYVRFPCTDGSRIVYHAGADLYLFDPQSGTNRKIDTRVRSSQSRRIRRFADASEYLESFDLHPKGHSLTSIHRGGLFAMGLWEGAVTRFGRTSEARYRLAAWLPDGRRIVALTDEDGDECLVVFDTEGTEKPRKVRGDFGRPIDLWVAPESASKSEGEKKPKSSKKKRKKPDRGRIRGDRLLLTNHRHEVILVDLASGRSRVLDRSAHHRINGAAWSPDARWVAYGYSSSHRTGRIRLYEVDTGRQYDICRHEDFFDGYPDFDPEGRYLYFVSWRTYEPVYDSLYFDLGFPKGAKPCLVPLREDIVSPFDSATRRPTPPGGGSNGEASDSDSESEDAFRIDPDGIERRVLQFPVPEGRYGRVMGLSHRVLFTVYPVAGSPRGQETDADGTLEAWDFKHNKAGRVAKRVSDFRLSLDRQVLGILSGSRLRAVAGDFKEDPEKDQDECSRETGWVDLERIPVAVIPALEWKQMYGEAWRLQRDHFWHPDMSGTNWEQIRGRYLPLLERVGSRTEFSDLMWEMQGELGTSHCYELGGDYRPRPNWRQGFLGADLRFDTRTRRWRIERLPEGDSWQPDARSPIAAPGADLRPGDEILSIAGEPVDRRVSPAERLVHMADRNVGIQVRRRRGRRTSTGALTIRTLSDETPLRYRDWVEANRTRVHSDSRDRVGYIHVPDMGPAGYAEFHRYFGPESERDGLIIDVRFNRGGHVSQLLLEKLLRRRIGYDISRWAEPLPYPEAAPMGPMVALTNEYAGSDGDIFCHAFKLLGLGPLIGKRTWGGVIGIWPRASLVDGTVTTQPEFAYWFEDVGYDVENYGTDPDIEVDIRPQDYAAGRDTQLERALSVVQRILREKGRSRPDFRRTGSQPERSR